MREGGYRGGKRPNRPNADFRGLSFLEMISVNDSGEYLTPDQLAALLSVSKKTLFRLVAADSSVPCIKSGARRCDSPACELNAGS